MIFLAPWTKQDDHWPRTACLHITHALCIDKKCTLEGNIDFSSILFFLDLLVFQPSDVGDRASWALKNNRLIALKCEFKTTVAQCLILEHWLCETLLIFYWGIDEKRNWASGTKIDPQKAKLIVKGGGNCSKESMGYRHHQSRWNINPSLKIPAHNLNWNLPLHWL